jgi:hypothetical protein
MNMDQPLSLAIWEEVEVALAYLLVDELRELRNARNVARW